MPNPITILDSVARTASDVSNPILVPRSANALLFVLTLTDAKKDSDDTLNIYVQHSPDGINFNDCISFSQILGNGADSAIIQANVNLGVTPTTPLGAVADGSLSPGTVLQGPIGSLIRVRYVIVDGGTDASQSFAFGLTMGWR